MMTFDASVFPAPLSPENTSNQKSPFYKSNYNPASDLSRGVCLGVTAGNASHNASNARDVTAGKMGRNSS